MRRLFIAVLAALALCTTAVAATAGHRSASRAAVDANLYIYLSGNGTGSVTASPPGLTCTQNCKATVPVGTTVTLTAKANPDSAIDTWSSGVCKEQGSNLSYTGTTCTVTMDRDKSVSVYFSKSTLYVYFGGNGTGTVTSSPPGISCNQNCKATYPKRAKVTLTAKADAGSAFDQWSGNVCAEQGSLQTYHGTTCTITLDNDKSVTAYFAKSTLYLYLSGQGGGTITSSPAGVNCNANCKVQFAKGTKVVLTVKPNAGSEVQSWSNDACAEQGSALTYKGTTCTVTLDNDKSVSVYFQAASGGGGGATIGSPTPPPPPKPGVAVNVESEGGTTLVKLPGSSAFRTLKGGAQVPVGSVVDTTKGRMGLTSSGGSADFSGGVFTVREPKVAGARVTNLALAGGNFATCPKATKRKTAGLASESAAPKVVRQLFGNGKGRFRTTGRFASATVRGTAWRMQDRCDGTLTRVIRGTVAVLDLKKHKTVLVKAGHFYLAKK